MPWYIKTFQVTWLRQVPSNHCGILDPSLLQTGSCVQYLYARQRVHVVLETSFGFMSHPGPPLGHPGAISSLGSH